MVSALPFDDVRRLLAELPDGDVPAGRKAGERLAQHCAPQGLSGIAELGAWLTRWSGGRPRIQRPLVAVFAGAHGIARHLIADDELQITHALVGRLGSGTEPVNRICAAADLGLKIFDLALDLPTGDISREAALGERDCAATMAFGMEAIAGGTDLLCLGDFGAGGAVVAAAVLAALHGRTGADWSEPTGDGAMASRVAACIDAALALHRAHFGDPLEVLRRLGGREIAAIAGAILAARTQKVPVVLEGPAALAAAAVLHAANPEALAHCKLAGRMSGPAFADAAARLGLDPLLEMTIGSAAGAGAAMAACVLKSAAAACSEAPAR